MPKKINPRLVIPRNVSKLLLLLQSIWDKHSSDGAASLLNLIPDTDWEALHPLIAQAKTLDHEAQQLKKEAENKIQQRNILLKKLTAGARRAGGFLKALNSNNPQTLGDWGFEVNASKQKKAPKKKAAVKES